MKLSMQIVTFLLVTLTLDVGICAPTSNSNSSETFDTKSDDLIYEEPALDIDDNDLSTEKTSDDPCNQDDLSDLLKCDNDDKSCESKNEQKRLKRQTVCSQFPQCDYCNLSNDIPTDGDNLIVNPEIVATISPLDNTENLPNPDENRPVKLIERNIVIENDNETQYYRGYVDPSSNITTIIRLTNLINNTNIVNMPTTSNNTNINNIHVYSNKSSNDGGKFGLGYTDEGPCCWKMKAGSCKRTTSGLKCRHQKTKICGRECTKKLIHPKKSLCNQIPQWPYLICPHQMQPPQYPYQFYPQYPNYYPQQPPFSDEFDDDLPLFPEEEELDREDSGWIVHQEKCKIVSEDGLHITNCTQKDVEFEHPYARNSIDDGLKRNVRQTGKNFHHQQQMQQQQPFMGYPYQMMPIFIQPIPMYIPQYFVPQQPNNFYPQQMPMPPLNYESYYDEPNLESKETNQYRNSRKHAKKHPIIMEHDDEL